MRRTLVVIALLLAPARVHAQELLTPLVASSLAPLLPAAATEPPLPAGPSRPVTLAPAPASGTVGRSVLLGQFATYAVLQALDVHSTQRALHAGGVEVNPMLAPVAGNAVALSALKGGMTFGTIYAVDRVSRHNKVAALVLMSALNTSYALIVTHNYRIAGRGPGAR